MCRWCMNGRTDGSIDRKYRRAKGEQRDLACTKHRSERLLPGGNEEKEGCGVWRLATSASNRTDGPASLLGMCEYRGSRAVGRVAQWVGWLKAGGLSPRATQLRSRVLPKGPDEPVGQEDLARKKGEGGGGGMARSTQHHQGDGPASSLGRVSMGTEQCAVVISLLKLKLWLKSIQSRA